MFTLIPLIHFPLVILGILIAVIHKQTMAPPINTSTGSAGSPPSPQEQFILIIAGVILPPLAVFLAKRYSIWNKEFWITLFLTLLGHLPGLVFAIYWLVCVQFPQQGINYTPVEDIENLAADHQQPRDEAHGEDATGSRTVTAGQQEGFIHHSQGQYDQYDRRTDYKHDQHTTEDNNNDNDLFYNGEGNSNYLEQQQQQQQREPYRDYDSSSPSAKDHLLSALDLPAYDDVVEDGHVKHHKKDVKGKKNKSQKK